MKRRLLFIITFVAFCIMLSFSANATVIEGSCGDGVTWGFSPYKKTLLIRGNGPMDDYDTGTAPWASYSSSIEK